MIKNRRSLDSIAGDIHKLQRSNVFAVGDLLLEAKDGCDHGEWGLWLQIEFDWSADTAERYMKVARLGTKFRNLRNLRLAKTTLYSLAEEDDEELLAAIIDALGKCATEAQLKAADADEVILRVQLRHQHGDLPDATLLALDRDIPPRAAWRDTAIAALKSEKPTTSEAANKIIADIRRARVDELFAPYGKLPDIPVDALHDLEYLRPERRAKVLERLQAAPQPLTGEQVSDICYPGHNDDEPDDDARPTSNALVPRGNASDGNGTDPQASAEARMAQNAALDGDQTKPPPPRAEVAKLVGAWVKANPEVRREFVRERWDEIESVRKQLDADGKAAEDRWSDSDAYERVAR
jgi:DUF3102 family protein